MNVCDGHTSIHIKLQVNILNSLDFMTLFQGFYHASKGNKAGYTATEVACGWTGAIVKVTRPFGQEQ